MFDNEKQKKLIGQRLNAALAMRNMRQKDLAHALGIQDNTVSYFCKGDRTPNTVQLVDICRILDVSADYLLGLTEVASTSVDIQNIVKATGLEEGTVACLVSRDDGEYGELQREFANFLIDSVFKSDITIPFDEMLHTLRVPSFMGCSEVLLKEWPTQRTDLPQELAVKAVMSGTERYFQEDKDYNHSQWTLEPESAFNYYCSVIADDIKDQIKRHYVQQNQWGDIEDIREELLGAVKQRAEELLEEYNQSIAETT